MVLTTAVQEQKPVGGSHFAGNYLHRPFECFAYSAPRGRITSSKRYPPPNDGIVENSALRARLRQTYCSERDASSLARVQSVGAAFRKQDEFDWVETFKEPKVLIPGNKKAAYHPLWAYDGPHAEEEKRIREKMMQQVGTKPRWFPRDVMQQTQPRTMLYKTDPQFHDNPLQFEIQNYQGPHQSPPTEVPQRNRRWSFDDSWRDPWNHAHLKITNKPIVKS
eukprot:GEMP01103188.1.p1 GENE.GEMP01103188.1~~GEMP01103188.1.p1  ORF type:complete len:221 (+),score=36.73 GEMP01103188.1:67-729(+)